MLSPSGHSVAVRARQLSRSKSLGAVWAFWFLLVLAGGVSCDAQDDVTTQNASSAMDGAWITGPASSPLSYLNGPAYRTWGSTEPYAIADFHPAADLDEKLPGWMVFETEERFRGEQFSNAAFQAGDSDSYLLNLLRVQADLRASSWFRFSAQLQDARPFFEQPPIGPPNENRWDLKLAYAEIGDPSRQWFSVRVGRQMINYNNTLIANSEWRNQGRSYDAAVMNLQSHGYHLGIFAASVVKPLPSGVSHHQQGNYVYGMYAWMKGPFANTSIEPFVLGRVQPSAVIATAGFSATGKQNMKAWGLRWKGQTASGIEYSAEGVAENGVTAKVPIRAWATTGGAAYRFDIPGHPRLFAQYDFASGAGAGSTTHGTFDSIYPTAHDRFGILDLFGWQNIHAVRSGITVEPHHRWSVSTQGLDFRSAKLTDAVYDSSGSPLARNATPRSSHVGVELDAYSWYELNRHFNIGAGYGWFGGGNFLSRPGGSHAYSSSYIVVNFKDHGRVERE